MRTTLWMFSLFCHLIFLSFDVCSTWFVCVFFPLLLCLVVTHGVQGNTLNTLVMECEPQSVSSKVSQLEPQAAHFVCFCFEQKQQNVLETVMCTLHINPEQHHLAQKRRRGAVYSFLFESSLQAMSTRSATLHCNYNICFFNLTKISRQFHSFNRHWNMELQFSLYGISALNSTET